NKAIELADRLLPAFATTKGIPKSLVNLANGELKNYGWTKDRSVLAEVGSNQMELFTLAHLTSNAIYYHKSKQVYDLLAQMEKPFGLYGRLIETDTAQFASNEQVYSIGAMSDSFYEYLLKTWIVTDYEYKDGLRMYLDSIDNLNRHLLRLVVDAKRDNRKFLFYGELWFGRFRGRMEELSCFMPGLLALGYFHSTLREKDSSKAEARLSTDELRLIQSRDTHLKLAHTLLESCVSVLSFSFLFLI
ncbi:mannosidase, alpha, class 1A, member 2, partial [Reticulomyxa filosa]